jgi:hypothetical protein
VAQWGETVEACEDVDRVGDVIEENVVERLIELEGFGIGPEESEARMAGAGDIDQLVADLHPDAHRGLHGLEEISGLAANVQDLFSRLHDEAEDSADLAVVKAIAVNPALADVRELRLLFPARLSSGVQRVGADGGNGRGRRCLG